MIFESLNQSVDAMELVLLHGGMCRFHLRRDGQITIHEIIVESNMRNRGIGRSLLEEVMRRAPYARCIVAKCPCDLLSNGFYARMKFCCDRQEITPSGRVLNVWKLDEEQNVPDLLFSRE